MKTKQEQMYVIKKYIMANSAIEAIKKDKQAPVHDVWVDEDYKKNNPIGYTK